MVVVGIIVWVIAVVYLFTYKPESGTFASLFPNPLKMLWESLPGAWELAVGVIKMFGILFWQVIKSLFSNWYIIMIGIGLVALGILKYLYDR